MKFGKALMLAIMPALLSSCGLIRIITSAPGPVVQTTHTTVAYTPSYTTTVTVPRQKTVTTITNVVTYDKDISLYLDLQAVAAAFAQASTVQEFEYLLNNSSYMLSNLDLNGDGWVDYLRVLETVQGYNHVFLIQAVLAPNVYQDVATLIAEVPSAYTYHVQVVGSSYIYGPKYIIQPVYVAIPPIFTYLRRPAYNPWRSPWYWGHYPSCYKRPAPVYVSHYKAYVDTYMRNHRYCHEAHYVQTCHYPEYTKVIVKDQRNDYGVQYPERSFTTRTANIPANNASGRVVNARDIQETRAAASTTRVEPKTSTRTATATSTTTRTPSTSGTTATTGTTTRTPSTGTTTTRQSATGTATTTTRQPATSGTTTTATGTTTRTPSTSGTTATSTSSSRSTATTTPSVRSNVSTSGTRHTSVTTSSGSTRSSSSSSTATRSSSSSSATRSSSSSSTATRSGSSTSTRR